MAILKNLLKRELIKTKVKLKTKEELFEYIADLASENGFIESKEVFLKALWERENQMNTEVSKGIGMPHTRSNTIKKDFVVFLVSKDGIKYGGFGKKVNIIVSIGVQSDSKTYVNVMAKIARLLSKEDIKTQILNADVPEDIIKTIVDFENSETVKRKQDSKEKYLAGIIINDDNYFKTAVELAIENGMDAPTIIDSVSGVKKLLFDLPFLGTFSLFSDKNMASQVIIGITDDNEYAEKLAGALKTEGVDIEKEGAGAIFLIKLFNVIGGVTELLDV